MSFIQVDEENIRNLLQNKDSKQTQRTVKRGVNRFRQFLTTNSVDSNFETFTKPDINENLRKFYVAVRKEDGEMMKSTSLTSLKYGLSKYLKDELEIDVQNDSDFTTSNNVYQAVLTDLKKKGLGSVEHKPNICQEDLQKLYDPSNVATNPDTPSGLLHKVWFDVMIYLCRRGRENQREMTKETFSVMTDGSGRQFVQQVIVIWHMLVTLDPNRPPLRHAISRAASLVYSLNSH